MLFQYNGGSSPLHRLGPLSKLIWVGCFSLLSMSWDSTLREAALLAVLIAVAGLGARLTLARQLRAMSFLIGLGIPYFILSILAIREGHEVASWGPIVITAEGLDIAGALTLRIFVLFLASYIYLSTTDPRDFVQALNLRLRVPYRFAFGISVALTFLPLLEEEGRTIMAARRVRGQEPPRGWSNRLSWWSGYAAVVLVNAVRRVQQTALAMEGKGFGAYAERTYLRTLKNGRLGYVYAVIAVFATAVLWWV
ncbi:energy-coupling factor transporter transmembrane protein EcfT [Paenibacillus sp. EKM202P]|uniref:energy-coupling factor transporter transmembrane component T family protein n=1 Tax=unclassified Paenibacillus TaxID=185978 RepID=UPI0013ECC310|nr:MULTISPECIES: energy-coupling factor transporter transmembrane component T [unclassified Paenibacillus]KAF6562437.1 energy-coupling factor transporter transmembrane protein EcfT [Paenibacillus sp. EKM202P]KAF6567259.1 energy-coupling factor transporter transmembrane protein EcfT [Paenibacillus sp. EKM207P]MCV9951798.1 energy-coupling factor transporter transmembrane protein EcfT [Paenibacillus sp. BT-177]